MILTVIGVLSTVIFTTWAIVISNLKTARETAKTTRRENLNKITTNAAKRFSLEEAKRDLEEAPIKNQYDQEIAVVKQKTAVQKQATLVNGILRTTEEEQRHLSDLEKMRAIDIVFTLTPEGEKSPQAESIKAEINERKRIFEAGEDTSDLDYRLREKTGEGLARERYRIRDDHPFKGRKKSAFERYVSGMNDILEAFSGKELEEGLKRRTEKVAEVEERHSNVARAVTAARKREARSPAALGSDQTRKAARTGNVTVPLGPAQSVESAIQVRATGTNRSDITGTGSALPPNRNTEKQRPGRPATP
ncbi:hypothetical protein HUT17_02325 [Nocardiopsis flavescens]|nr:hypothetical protein HUT17_02325 [Nocardiopsis flavescens]